jgi:hypothetical protein
MGKKDISHESRTSEFETGWYIPASEVLAGSTAGLDPEEERNGLGPKEFYDLVSKLVERQGGVVIGEEVLDPPQPDK